MSEVRQTWCDHVKTLGEDFERQDGPQSNVCILLGQRVPHDCENRPLRLSMMPPTAIDGGCSCWKVSSDGSRGRAASVTDTWIDVNASYPQRGLATSLHVCNTVLRCCVDQLRTVLGLYKEHYGDTLMHVERGAA